MTSARELTTRLAELLRQERHAMGTFLLALADFDARKAWRELGHASLFSFLRRELGLSAGAAQYRKTAAELIQRFPEVEAALRSGRLCLSSIIELAKVVTTENVSSVLPQFFGLSRREAADVAVSIRPVESPPIREVVTALVPAIVFAPGRPDSRSAAVPSSDPTQILFRPAEADAIPDAPAVGSMDRTAAPVPAAVARAVKRSTVEPLDAELVRLHLTVSRRLLAKIEAAKDALSHSRPGASSEEVLEACLDLLLTQRSKRKGIVEKPRTTSRPVTSEVVPAAVKREAWKRSRGRCEWRLESGGTCGSTVRLEFDHITPRAHGGPSIIDNVRILCRAHNQLAARQVFGDRWMEQFGSREDVAGHCQGGATGRPPMSRLQRPAGT